MRNECVVGVAGLRSRLEVTMQIPEKTVNHRGISCHFKEKVSFPLNEYSRNERKNVIRIVSGI